MLADLHPPAEACLVDGFRLGPLAPPHAAVVDGDTKSAAIAAASIVAKVTRDRLMRRLDALYPRYGFSSHVGYITPGAHARGRRPRPVPAAPSVVRRRAPTPSAPRREPGRAAAARHYRLRGYRILGANVRAGGYELDLIVRRGARLVFVEVKERARESVRRAESGRSTPRSAVASGARLRHGSRPIPRRPPSRSASRSRRSAAGAWSASSLRTMTVGGNGGNARSVRLTTKRSTSRAGGHYPPTGALVNTGRGATAAFPGASAASSEVAGETSG